MIENFMQIQMCKRDLISSFTSLTDEGYTFEEALAVVQGALYEQPQMIPLATLWINQYKETHDKLNQAN